MSRTGSSLWAVRYATEGRARSLFASAEVDSLHQLYPEKKMWFATATSGDRLIASEPFSDLRACGTRSTSRPP